MSYILDALQEAQKNREGGSVPDLTSVPNQPKPGSWMEHRRGYLVGIVALIISGLTIGWLSAWWSSDPEQHLVSKQPVSEQTVSDQAVSGQNISGQAPSSEAIAGKDRQPNVPIDSVINDTAIESIEQGLEEDRREESLSTEASHKLDESELAVSGYYSADSSINSNTVAGPLVDSTLQKLPTDQTTKAKINIEPDARESSELPLQAASEASQKITDSHAAPADKVLKLNQNKEFQPLLTEQTVVDELPERAQVSGKGSDQNSSQQKAPQFIEPVLRTIPHFRELPLDIQQSLPPIKYSVHLYSAKPEHRMVKIDGLVRREGDTVKPGLVLEEITPTGAVFSFKEKVFRVPVNG